MAEVVKKPNASFKPDKSVLALSLSNLQLNLKTVLSQGDINLDGQVDLQEFKGGQRLSASQHRALEDKFKFFDVDGDGAISPHDDLDSNGIINRADRVKQNSFVNENLPYGYDKSNTNNVTINKALTRQEKTIQRKINQIDRGVEQTHINYAPKEETLNKKLIAVAISKVYSFSVPINSLNPQLEGFIILHLSDLHLNTVANPEALNELKSLVSKLPKTPDVIVMTGDFIRDDTQGFDSNTVKQLANLCPNVPMLAVLGNHDYFYFDKNGVARRHDPKSEAANFVQRSLENVGVTVLRNESIRMMFKGAPVNFTGVEDFTIKAQVNPSAPTAPANELNIYLTHNLDTLDRSVPKNYDLALSGHTHSGELDLGVYSGYDFIMRNKDFVNLNDHKIGFKALTLRTMSYISPGFARRLGVRIGPGVQNSGITLLTLKNFKED